MIAGAWERVEEKEGSERARERDRHRQRESERAKRESSCEEREHACMREPYMHNKFDTNGWCESESLRERGE